MLTWAEAGIGFLLLCAGLLGWELGYDAARRAAPAWTWRRRRPPAPAVARRRRGRAGA